MKNKIDSRYRYTSNDGVWNVLLEKTNIDSIIRKVLYNGEIKTESCWKDGARWYSDLIFDNDIEKSIMLIGQEKE